MIKSFIINNDIIDCLYINHNCDSNKRYCDPNLQLTQVYLQINSECGLFIDSQLQLYNVGLYMIHHGFVTRVTRRNEAGTAYPSGAHEFIHSYQWGSCCSIFCFLYSVLQIVVCPFVFFTFGHCVVCPISMDFDYLFGISKPIVIYKFVLKSAVISACQRGLVCHCPHFIVQGVHVFSMLLLFFTQT